MCALHRMNISCGTEVIWWGTSGTECCSWFLSTENSEIVIFFFFFLLFNHLFYLWLCPSLLYSLNHMFCSLNFPMNLFILDRSSWWLKTVKEIIWFSWGIWWRLAKCYILTETWTWFLDEQSACLPFPVFRDIPRIPDSTHAQLESSKFRLWGRKILFHVSTNKLKNVVFSQYISSLCLHLSQYVIFLYDLSAFVK